jgi:CheY-like chemotaxis protein
MGVESRLGEGTTFWFTLPIDGSGPVPTSRDTAHPAHRPALASDTERVLVLVSRDAAVAEFLQHHLNDCRTVVTPDLSSAVRAAVDLRALAILTDIETDETAARHGAATVHAGAGRDETGPAPPGVNGEVADDIASPVPIVRLPLPRSDRLAAALGADACLAKPIERRELAATLDRIDRTIQRVLVVDDDPDFVRLITRMLRANLRTSDATIHGAHTGREALAAIESSFEPDVILLDLSMPEMTGAELLAHLRGSGDRVDLPVILISGQDQLAGQTVHEGRLSLEKAEGFGLEEILDLVDAILGALRPPRHYLSAPVR